MADWGLIAGALGAGVLLIGAVWVLHSNAKSYIAKSEARWPMLGARVKASNTELHVVEAGPKDAPALLLLHGASANLREVWTPLGVPLSQEYRVLAIDRPGYGYSARPKGAAALGVQAQLVNEVLEQAGARNVTVIAHSLGSAVALRLALDFPERVRGLVLMAPASHPYPGKNVWWARLAARPLIGAAFSHLLIPALGPARVKSGIKNTFFPAEPPEDYFEDAGVGLAFRPGAFRASAIDVVASKREFAAQAPRYGDVMAPAIIITGEKDRVVWPKIHARALAVDLAAAELVTAPGAGHMPHRTRPDLVIAAVERVESMAAPALPD